MLENVRVRLMRDGLPHANAPDKVPSLRLRTIEEAGKRSIAFTTGILIGIGETMEERIDSLLAIRKMHEKRSEEHTSELQSRLHLVCRLLLEKKKNQASIMRCDVNP